MNWRRLEDGSERVPAGRTTDVGSRRKDDVEVIDYISIQTSTFIPDAPLHPLGFRYINVQNPSKIIPTHKTSSSPAPNPTIDHIATNGVAQFIRRFHPCGGEECKGKRLE